MKDFAHERLPRGYELYETVDLAGKAMKVMAIFVVLLTLESTIDVLSVVAAFTLLFP